MRTVWIITLYCARIDWNESPHVYLKIAYDGSLWKEEVKLRVDKLIAENNSDGHNVDRDYDIEYFVIRK